MLNNISRSLAGQAKYFLFISIILYLVFAISLVYVQKPHEDEMIPTNVAFNLAAHGSIGMPQVSQVIPYLPFWKGVDKHSYQYPPLGILTQAGWFKIFGTGLFRLRTLSVLFGIIGLVSWFYILKQLGLEKKVILLALILMSTDFIYTRFSAHGRTLDIMCAALAFASWASYLSLREKSFSKALLISNTLVVLSGLTHQNGILGLAGLVFLILYHDRHKLKMRHVLLSLMPYIIGGVGWGYYILQDIDAFYHQFIQVTFGQYFHKTQIGLNLKIIHAEIRNRYLFAYGFSDEFPLIARFLAFILIVYFGSFIGLVFNLKKHYASRIIFVLTTIYFFLFMFVNRAKWPIYLCHIVPLYAVSVAIFWSQLREGSFIKRLLTISIPIVLLLSSGVNLYRIKRDSYHNEYLPDIKVMQQLLSPDDSVTGPWETAFDLGFDRVAGDHTLGYYSKQQPNFIITNSVYEREFRNFQKTRPEVFAHIQDMLHNKYQLVYEGELYKIYKKSEKQLN